MDIKDYEFNVGDEVITIEGVRGKIIDICTCEQCEKRGFYELNWKENDNPDGFNYITKFDATHGFSDYYKIGKYRFNDFCRDIVRDDIAWHETEIEKLRERLHFMDSQ